MTIADVVPAFLAACPGIDAAWQEYLTFWGDEPDRGAFNDAGVISRHIVDSFERGELAEFSATFSLLEKCLVEGDEQVQSVAAIGVIEGIQNIASHREFGMQVFCKWLGPKSQSAWDELCVFWQRVTEAKAAGLLESDAPIHQPVEASQVQDPALRSIIEGLSRK